MNPLDQLAPLLPPPAIAWWPPAPGWWLAGLCGLATLVGLGVGLWRLWQRRATHPAGHEQPTEPRLEPLRQQALDQLHGLPLPYDQPAGPWLQQLNGLLKRLCLARYPQSQVQPLSGRAWLAFLDSRCPAAGLTRWMILVEGAYQPDCRLDDKAIRGLLQAMDTWVRKHV